MGKLVFNTWRPFLYSPLGSRVVAPPTSPSRAGDRNCRPRSGAGGRPQVVRIAGGASRGDVFARSRRAARVARPQRSGEDDVDPVFGGPHTPRRGTNPHAGPT